jgi:hypothetical protein
MKHEVTEETEKQVSVTCVSLVDSLFEVQSNLIDHLSIKEPHAPRVQTKIPVQIEETKWTEKTE